MKRFTPALSALGACGIIVALWGGLFVQAERERTSAIAVAIELNDNLAVAFEQYVTRTLQSADTITRFLEENLKTSDADEALARLVRTGVLDRSLFQGIGVFDAHGDLVATTMNDVGEVNFADREHFQVHAAREIGQLFIGKPVVSRLLNEASIPLTRRLTKANGEFGGVVIAQVSPQKIVEFYKGALLRPDDIIALTGLDGVNRARLSGVTVTSGADLSRSHLFSVLKDGPKGNFRAASYLDPTMRYFSYRVLPDYPLIVTVAASEGAVLADVNLRQSRTQIFAILATAILAYLTMFLICALIRRDTATAEVEESARRLTFAATHDPLTRLPNRSVLNMRGQDAIKRAQTSSTECALIYLDLDNFKLHNDAFGHSSGDEILKAVATELRKLLRAGDFLARFGSDEFVILLENLFDAREVASIVATKIRKRFQEPLVFEESAGTLTLSSGISIYPRDGATLDELLRHADTAMHQAKDNGRGQACFYTKATPYSAAERVFLERELRKAIRLDELELFYQPQVELVSGANVGLEALLRWRHPQLGLVSPTDFIPIAESSGLILPIGEWVLRTACWQVKAWQDAGVPVAPVAVNISALQFKQPDIVNVVAATLAETGLAPDLLELELTESLMVGSPELATPKLAELKALGVTLALDDFGTGYSNLQYLKRFPLDVLKIDRSFVLDVPKNIEGALIAKAIIGLAHSLNLRVVAEGIETSDQAEFLMLEGCEVGQGFLYSRPLTAVQCAEWLIASRVQQALAAKPTLAA